MRPLLILFLLMLPAPLAAQILATPASPVIETAAEALSEDAGEYARAYQVGQAEAERRLHAQAESVATTDRIAERYRDRLAGISVEHRPDYRIAVYLTGDQPVAERRLRVGGIDVPITFRTGARATREQVTWAITYHQAAIRALFANPPGMGLDPRTGELVVIVDRARVAQEGAATLQARLEAIAGVPVQVRVLDHVDVNLSIEGGSRVEGVSPTDGKRYLCTTGFIVTDGQQYGVATAAHCLDELTYYDPQRGATPMTFAGQWGWGYRDVQVNVAPTPLRPLFYADSAKTRTRVVGDARGRDSTRAGDFVCHRGERTGYSCAEVELIDFAPAGDLCGGACLPTWVTVAGPHCKGGDSGAPVFTGTTAFGIVKGASYRQDGSCAFYFYMSADYLPPEWSLLREDPAAALMPAVAP